MAMRGGMGAILTIGIVVCTSGCTDSSDAESEGNGASVTVSAEATTEVDGPSEEALLETLDAFYQTTRDGDYEGTYGFYSARCQSQMSEEEFVQLLKGQYGDRDLSGQPEFLTDVEGSVATVVTKSADGEGSMEPRTWTYADGSWRFDNC